ncbi:MAG: chromosomal replication initiator protein DnaA [Ruminococcaceae bacterium]|nr:chromosomal replication initiator protein DnaA [Oscillospiraceae bacterium]MBQ9692484.1 chromosomal replication initiator protein DnaA [Clostridia bacterium]
MQELDEIWSLALEYLKTKYSDAFMTAFIKDLRLALLTDTKAVIFVPSDLKRKILESNHSATISESIENIMGCPVSLEFTSDLASIEDSQKREDEYIKEDAEQKDMFMKTPVKPTVDIVTPVKPVPPSHKQEFPFEEESFSAEKQPSSGVISPENEHSSEYTFDNFIVGASNKFVYAACTSVAKNPAHSYNPLFVYGPSGLGKTHLLYAITNEIHKNHPNYNIIYIKGEDFTNEMIASIAHGHPDQFREKYRKADVLLIDDIHFIAGKDSTQEEFFHTFNDLYEHKKQIILTSDRPARDIQKLEERLRTRFEWGLSADIQPPDFELRIAIMKKKAEGLGKEFSNEVLTFLAEKLTNNVRQIEGAIKRIIAYSLLTGEEITIPLVQKCIADLLVNNGSVNVTPEKIVKKVAIKYGVSTDDIYSKKKSGVISNARHISIYLMRRLADLSYPQIGKILNRDHTTVLASFRIIDTEIKNNSTLEIEINELIKEIKS